MKKIRVILLAFLALSCAKEIDEHSAAGTVGGEIEPETPISLDYDRTVVPGTAKICFSDEIVAEIEAYKGEGLPVTKSSELGGMLAELGITSMERLFPYAGEYEPRTREAGLHKWYIVTFDEQIPVTKAEEDLAPVKGVETFEPVRKIAPLATNDSYWRNMWGLNNSNGYNVDVLPVWDNYTVGNPDVVVAVVDGGLQLDHPDLAWNCLESGHYNYVTNSTNIVPDSDGHGTHVAGTIAAVSNNGIGVAGVAGGDYAAGRRGVSLLSLAVFSGNRSAYSFETAIKAGADKGALICQNSWGYVVDVDDNGQISQSELNAYISEHNNPSRAFTQAVDYFIKNAGCDALGNQKADSPMKGGIVLFAAGNDNLQYGPPSNYEPIVAVGAIQSNGNRASFSNYGDWVDICAPGVNIYSTIPTNKYASYGGTSMACPHVSGVAALLISYFGGPGFTCTDLKEALLGGAREIGASTGSKPIGPLVDANGSFLYMIAGVPDPVTDYTASSTGNSISINLEANGSYGYMAAASKSREALESMDPRNPGSNIITERFVSEEKVSGEDITVVLRKLEFSTDYYVTVLSYGTSYTEPAPIKQVRTGVNHAPVINLDPGIGDFSQWMNISLPVEIYDPDYNDIDVSFTTNGRARLEKDSDGVWRFLLNCQLANPGDYTAKITVRDEYGLQTVKSFSYSVKENEIPINNVPFEEYWISSEGDSITLDLDEFFYDPDEEPLSYSGAAFNPLDSNIEVIKAKVNGSTLTITAVSNGLGRVKVVASDAIGDKAIVEFPVLVRPVSEKVTLIPGTTISNELVLLAALSKQETEFSMVSTYGVNVFNMKSVCSAFEPVTFRTNKLARGIYYLTVSYGGNAYKYTIVKK